jgi:hypothetical protein
MRNVVISLACLSATAALAGAQTAVTDKLTPGTYQKLRDLVEVKASEMAWQAVTWKDNFFDGLVEAQARDMPIFFWIYEGDPRKGC